MANEHNYFVGEAGALVHNMSACDLNGPGRFEHAVENMSLFSAAYQKRITGLPVGTVYKLNGVKFDGFKNGVLLDAKARYSQFLQKNGQFHPWYKGAQEFSDQARRQLNASKGVPIEWHFAEASVAKAVKSQLLRSGISGIKILHTMMD